MAGYELAVYGYYGYWKSSGGQNPSTGKSVFPILAVYGASARGPFLKGIGNLEAGYYDSEEERGGDDPFMRNSEFRFLAGYEQEAGTDFTTGFQYYLEPMGDHGDYRRTLPVGMEAKDENRRLLTVRLTKLLWNHRSKRGRWRRTLKSANPFSWVTTNLLYQLREVLEVLVVSGWIGGL